MECNTGKGSDHALSFPLRRTNVVMLWVWNMHECLEQFKYWLKCKLDDVCQGACCLLVSNRKYSQHGDRVFLVPLQSRWCCDSIGTIKLICRTAHHPSLALGLQWATTHVLTPVWGERACPPGRKSSFYTVNVLSLTDRPSPSAGSPLQPLCNHGDKAVTLHLRQRVTSGLYCLIQSPGMTWIFYKSFNGVSNICCAVALLDSQFQSS